MMSVPLLRSSVKMSCFRLSQARAHDGQYPYICGEAYLSQRVFMQNTVKAIITTLRMSVFFPSSFCVVTLPALSFTFSVSGTQGRSGGC